MRYFQSPEFVNCYFLPIADANKNSKWVWGKQYFKSQFINHKSCSFLSQDDWLISKYLVAKSWLKGTGGGKSYWKTLYLLAAEPKLPFFSRALACSSCCVRHKPPSLSSLCSVLSPLLAVWGMEEAGCIWNLILLEVGVAELQKVCQQTREAGPVW